MAFAIPNLTTNQPASPAGWLQPGLAGDSPGSMRPIHHSRAGVLVFGRAVVRLFGWIGANVDLLRAVLLVLWRDRPRRLVFAEQLYRVGFESLPIVLVTGVSMGLVMAVQAYATLAKFDAEIMSGPMVMYALVAQIGPSMTALLVAGRAGSHIAAELGTMKVTEQVDALRTMGTDPVSYLVAPRVVALTLLLPVLGAFAGVLGTLAGAFLLTTLWGVDPGAYWHQTRVFVATWDICTGLGKCPFLGLCIGIISCREGLRAHGGATGVGEACTRAVVYSSMAVLVMNFVLTLISNKLWHLL